MNKAELQELVYQNMMKENTTSSLSKTDVIAVVDATFDTIKTSLKDVKSIAVRGFGSFECVHSKARTARNPKTGEPVAVPAKNKAKFKPSSNFQDTVN